MQNQVGFKPNIFIVGAAKCGTTSLHKYLSQVEGVCMSNPKEPFFFECEYNHGLSYYQSKYFSHWKGETLIGEARHRNMYLPYVAKRLYEVNPEAKIIVIIRNPVERAFAHWWHWYYRRNETDSFEVAIKKNMERLSKQAVNQNQQEEVYCEKLRAHGGSRLTSYVDSGYYAPQLDNLMQYFKKEQILVIQNASFKSKRQEVLTEVLSFIGVNPDRVSEIDLVQIHNKKNRSQKFPQWVYKLLAPTGILNIRWVNSLGKSLRKKMFKPYVPDPDTVALLEEHYRPYNRKLEQLLDIDLSYWDKAKI